ncbi:tetratricopeptide repeat protein [Microcoleus sp. AT3-A2]|uniref:tetratricopeptide repeat protein n=1 Tax=Microcoleus sp. AT3-A2 TaxID=2818610 RepID=UPI002FD27AEA
MNNSLQVHEETASNYFHRGNLLKQSDKLEEAAAAYQRCTELNPDFSWYHHNLGEVLAKLGQRDGAEKSYRTACELNPNSAWSWHNIGEVLEQQGNLDEAVAAYRKAVEIYPDFYEFYNSLGKGLCLQGQLDESISCLRKAIELDPESALPYQNLWEALARQGRVDEGIECLRHAIDLNPGDGELYLKLAEALQGKNDLAEAVGYYRKGIQLKPDFHWLYYKLGTALATQGQWEEAIAAYTKAADLEPGSAIVHHYLGHTLSRVQRWEEAITSYRKALDIVPDAAIVSQHLGDALTTLGRWEQAVGAYRNSVEIEPNSLEAQDHLGFALYQLGEYDEAIAAYRKALEVAPNSDVVNFHLGDALCSRGRVQPLQKDIEADLDAAVNCYRRSIEQNPNNLEVCQKALEIQPDDAELYLQFGKALAQQNQLEGASVQYRHAVELNPELWEAHHYLGEALVKLGRWEDAIASCRKAIKLIPDVAVVYYHLGQALTALQMWEQAVVEYSHAIKLEANSVAYQHGLGYALAKVKRWDEAIACYHRAIELNPNFFDSIYNLGEALAQQGQIEEAIGCYHRAIELNPNSFECLHKLGEILAQQEQIEEAIACYRHAVELNPQCSWLHQKLRKLQAQKGKTDFEGHLDFATSNYVSGWVRDHNAPDKVVFVDIFVGNNLVGNCAANKFRKDLAKIFHNHGCYGFYFELPSSLNSQSAVDVSVRISENAQNLQKSPVSLVIGPKGQKHDSKVFVKHGSLDSKLLYRSKNKKSSQDLVQPTVAIIILNLNAGEFLNKLFHSFGLYNSYESIEFLIVDHGSDDDSIDVCQRWSETLPIKIIDRAKNYSFANSNNLAASKTQSPLVLFLNNDITFCQDIIPELVNLMQDPEIGIVGVKLLDVVQSGSLALPPTQHLGVQFNFYNPNELSRPFEVRYTPQLLDVQMAPWKVPAVTGAAMMCRREDFLAAGQFQEKYFYGLEDVDLCVSFRQFLGKEIICANHLTAFHHRGLTRFSGGKGFDKRMGNNRSVFDSRFGYLVRRSHLRDFFENPLFWTSHPMRIGFAVTEADMAASAGDYFTAFELGEQLVREFGWEVFYLSEGPDWYDMTMLDVLVVMRHNYDLRLLHNTKPTLVKVAWARNWFKGWDSQKWSGDYDCFWCSSVRGTEYIKSKLSKQVNLLRIASNPERFSSGRFDPKFKSDYCFTGSYWQAEREIIKFLDPDALPFNFALYGHNWENVIKFKNYYRGPVPYTDLPKVYASTKIVIDDANSVTKEWGSVNSRVFDALMAGTLVITNGKLGNEEAFNGLLPTYDSQESLEKLLSEFLTDENKRLERVAKLQKIALEQHTYNNRAHTVFALLRDKICSTFRISIKIGVPNWEVANEWGDYHFALAMKRAFERKGHSVRIDILPDWETPKGFGDDVAIVLRGLSSYKPKPYHINIMWNISHPDKISLSEYEQFDYVFVASLLYAEELKQTLKVPVAPLLQCTDPDLFYPDKSGIEKVGEILFVGNSRKVYRHILRDAIESGLAVDVYGTNWEPFLSPDYLKGQHIPNEVLRRYYTRCGVLLNDHWETMQKKGFISNRLFDAAACGAVIVSDKISGLEEVFDDVIITYSSPKELPAIVQTCLARHSDTVQKRRKLSQNIRQHHTFDKRVGEMLTVIEQLNAEKMRPTSISNAH